MRKSIFTIILVISALAQGAQALSSSNSANSQAPSKKSTAAASLNVVDYYDDGPITILDPRSTKFVYVDSDSLSLPRWRGIKSIGILTGPQTAKLICAADGMGDQASNDQICYGSAINPIYVAAKQKGVYMALIYDSTQHHYDLQLTTLHLPIAR